MPFFPFLSQPPSPGPLLIVGTDTQVGKTTLALIWAKRWGWQYWKPIQSGAPGDFETALQSLPAHFVLPPRYSFQAPEAPLFAAVKEKQEGVTRSGLNEAFQKLPSKNILLEGIGGILTPVAPDFLWVDWMQERKFPFVLVCRSQVGTLNHTLLTLESLRRRGLEPLGLVLVGPFHSDNQAALPSLSRLPLLEVLVDDTTTSNR